MRCKACNTPFEPSEIIWIEEIGDHEPLCRKCRDALREADGMDIIHEDELDIYDSISDTTFQED